MTFKYGAKSLAALETCDERIDLVFREVLSLQIVDVAVLEGYRTLEQQQDYFRRNLSELDGVNQVSKHQSFPSLAIDAAPFPLDWNDPGRFAMFAGLVLGVAKSNGIEMLWGGDWDRDFSALDHKFFDGPHFEIVE